MKLLLLCCSILVGVACHGALVDRFKTSANSPRESLDPRGTLTKAMRAMLAAKSYRARVESSTSSGTTSKTLVEFVAPDNFHLTREATVPSRGPTKQETIVVGDDTWMKMGDSPWQKFPMSLGDLITQFRDPKIVDEIGKSLDVKFVGSDVLDGSQTIIYQYTLGDPNNKELGVNAKTWVGVTDNLPRKTESEGDVNLAGRQIHTKSIITYYDYEADIKIDKPL